MKIHDNSFFKIIRALFALITGGRYISSIKMVNASVWWENQDKLIVSSFEEIKVSTAIGYVNSVSAKIYMPVRITKSGVHPIMYQAELKAKLIMLPDQLEKWVDEIDRHPFI